MKKKLRIVLAQLNLTVGDIEGNVKKHIDAAIKARDEMSADLIVFPELGLTGYPAEDIWLRHEVLQQEQDALKKFTHEVYGIYCLVSHTESQSTYLYNNCSMIYNGSTLGTYSKQHLPNYGVFDEDRYFSPGTETCVIRIKDIPVGVVICEDLWFAGPTQEAVKKGARIILSPNASPFETDKHEKRVTTLQHLAKETHTPIFYVNTVGGQDELIFDGGSMLVNGEGKIVQFAGFFNEKLLPVDIEINPNSILISPATFSIPVNEERIYNALVLAVKDYINKNQIPGVLVGLSGGIDSALTLAIAVDALGKDRVKAVFMPSRYSATISSDDATTIAKKLGVHLDVISIEPMYQSFLDALSPLFKGKTPDITEENIQARCRAIILMALSNKSGYLVLTTSNRSEMAVGYCTLYGDMAGGFAPLKDVPKTMIYQLAHYRNQIKQVIPDRVLERAPTAELAPNQKDEDTLPPYSILDKILDRYLNQNQQMKDIVAAEFDRDTVSRVISWVKRNEYKRKQSALGPRINQKSFGKDWRYPVTNKFKD